MFGYQRAHDCRQVLEFLDIKMKESIDQQAEMNARKQAALDLRDQLTQGVQLVCHVHSNPYKIHNVVLVDRPHRCVE
jgi:hypothetical protein